MPMRLLAFDRKNPVRADDLLELLGIGRGQVRRASDTGRTAPGSPCSRGRRWTGPTGSWPPAARTRWCGRARRRRRGTPPPVARSPTGPGPSAFAAGRSGRVGGTRRRGGRAGAHGSRVASLTVPPPSDATATRRRRRSRRHPGMGLTAPETHRRRDGGPGAAPGPTAHQLRRPLPLTTATVAAPHRSTCGPSARTGTTRRGSA